MSRRYFNYENFFFFKKDDQHLIHSLYRITIQIVVGKGEKQEVANLPTNLH